MAEEETSSALEALSTGYQSRRRARATDESWWDTATSNLSTAASLANPVTFMAGLVGLAGQGFETGRSVLEMPGTLGVAAAAGIAGASDEDVARTVRDVPGLQWVVNEEAWDPVTDRRARFDEMFPLAGTAITSLENTAGRVRHPERYAQAWREGMLPAAAMEDVLNVAAFVAPGARALSRTGSAAAAGEVAAAAGRMRPIAAVDSAIASRISPAAGARLARAGDAVALAARAGERGAFAPAWPARVARYPVRRVLTAAEDARVAVRDLGPRASRAQRVMAPAGRGVEALRRVGDSGWVSARTRPMVEERNLWAGEHSDLVADAIAPMRAGEHLVPDVVEQQAVLGALRGLPVTRSGPLTWARWEAIPAAARAQWFESFRGNSLQDLSIEGFELALRYQDRLLDDATLTRFDEAAAHFRDAAEVLAEHERHGRGVQSLTGRTAEQQAYVDANLDNQPLDPWVRERVDADHAAQVGRAEQAYDRLVQSYAKRWMTGQPIVRPDPAPVNVGGVRVPGMTPPEPGFARYDYAVEELLRRSTKEGDLAKQVRGNPRTKTRRRGAYSGAMDDLYRSTLDDVERGLDDPSFELVDVDGARQMPRGQLEEAYAEVESVRSAAAAAADDLERQIRDHSWGALPPITSEMTNVQRFEGRAPNARRGTGGERDFAERLSAHERKTWNRFAYKSEEISKSSGRTDPTKAITWDAWLDVWNERRGTDLGMREAVDQVFEMIGAIDELRDVARGRRPQGSAWRTHLDTGSEVTDAVVASFDQYGGAQHMATAWRNGLDDKRVRLVAARAADKLADFDADMAARYGETANRWDRSALVAERVDAAMNESARRAWDAFNHDFVVGMKSRQGYGSLTKAERKVYDAYATHSKWETARYMTRKQREKVSLRRQQILDNIADSIGRQQQRAQDSVNQQVERRLRTAKKEGIRAGTTYGRRLEQRRVAARDMERARRQVEEARAAREADFQGRIAQGQGLPSRYRPAFAQNQALADAGQAVADDLRRTDPTAAAQVEALAGEIVVAADELMGAMPQRPTFLTGGAITRGDTGAPSGVPKSRRSSAEKVKTGETTPLTFRGQAVVTARRLRTDGMNEVSRRLADRWAVRPADAFPDVAWDGVPGQTILDDMASWAERLDEHPVTGAPGGYRWVPWDPMSPFETVPVNRINASTMFVPEPMHQLFKAEWRDPRAWEQRVYQFYDKPMGLWKDQVLALSSRWHMGNLIGGLVLGSTAGGVQPLELIREFAREWQRAAPEPAHVADWRRRGAERRYARAQAIDAAEGPLPRELFWGSGVDHDLRRYTRDIDVIDPARGTIRPEAAMNQRPTGRYRRMVNASYRLNQRVDDAIRAAIYTSHAGKGMAADEALRIAMGAMPDFRLLPWEQTWMRRVFPFYAWLRHMTQVSYRLSRDHPMRVAWMLRISNEFAPEGAREFSMMAQQLPIGGDRFVNLALANPYGDLVPFSPGRITGALSPAIKLPTEALTGMTFDAAGRPIEALSRPPGSGHVNDFGVEGPKPLLPGIGGDGDLSGLAWRAAGITPATRLMRDLVSEDVARYDTGAPVRVHSIPGTAGRTIDQSQPGGRWGAVARTLGVPVPTMRDMDEMRRARDERLRRAQAAAESYAR